MAPLARGCLPYRGRASQSAKVCDYTHRLSAITDHPLHSWRADQISDLCQLDTSSEFQVGSEAEVHTGRVDVSFVPLPELVSSIRSPRRRGREARAVRRGRAS